MFNRVRSSYICTPIIGWLVIATLLGPATRFSTLRYSKLALGGIEFVSKNNAEQKA